VALSVTVHPKAYHDSVTLMQVSAALADAPGVEAAAAVMATPLNRDYLREGGLLDAAAESAGPDDLVIAVRAATAEQARAAQARALALLAGGPREVAPGAPQPPRSLTAAHRRAPDATLALVSVPGPYAAGEARQALAAGLDVFLFSDNVLVEDEVALKRLAERRGRLVMGPECGTAILDGVGLGFANRVRCGSIGLVGASGTGLQEVSVLLHRWGSGVSQAIGTGGRDLSAAVGGLATRAALRRLAADPATERVVLVSKPPSEAVAREALSWLAASGKPAVACFLGVDLAEPPPPGVVLAATLEETAWRALGRDDAPPMLAPGLRDQAAAAAGRLAPGQEVVAGLFSGGSLHGEAALVLGDAIPTRFTDLGDAEYTAGRPHPIIDSTLRVQHLLAAAADPTVAVLLLDVVLGYGAHPDPAGALAGPIRAAREQAERAGRYLPVVAYLCGTEDDPQGLAGQAATLRQAGALLAETNAMAARLAGAIASRGG